MWRFKGFCFPADLVLLLRICWLSTYYGALIKMRPMPLILLHIQSLAGSHAMIVQPDCRQLETMDKIWRGTTFYLTRIWRSPRPCLRRSLILYRWCCLHGIPARIVIGVRKEQGDLQGHSWLLLNGMPYHESLEDLAKYTIVLEG